MNKNDIKMLSEAYLKIHEDLDKPNFGNLSRSKPERYERIEGQKEIIHHPPETASDYDQEALNYSYRNWRTADDEQSRETDKFEENPQEYLAAFPKEIRKEYGILVDQYIETESREVIDRIVDLLKQYISYPELEEQDFWRWQNEVVFGEEPGEEEYNESYKKVTEAKARPSVFDEPSEQEGQTKIEWIWAAPDAETARQRFIKVVKETDMISEPQKAEMIRNAMGKKTKSDMDMYAHSSRMARLGMGIGQKRHF